MSRWWGWTLSRRDASAEARRQLAAARHELAELGDSYQALHVEHRRALTRNDELEKLADQRREWLQEARSYSATVEQAGQELGEKLQQAEDRLGRIGAVLAVDRLPPDVRLAKVHQVLTEGKPATGGDAG